MRDDDCPMHGGGMMGGMMDPGKMTERSDARLGELKSELAITPAQEAVWTAYADAIKARVASMAAMHPGMSAMMSGGTAKERLAVRITAMEGMLDTLKQVQPATDALYGALSADQQKRADKVLGAGCGMM